MILKPFVILSGASLLMLSCGGHLTGGDNPDRRSPGGQPGGGSDQQGKVYLDVFSLHDGVHAPVGKWPSQLRQGELVDACPTGKIFYADQCWESLTIDVNKQEVIFFSEGGVVANLATGKPIPSDVGTLFFSQNTHDDKPIYKLYFQQKPNTGYLRAGECLGSYRGAEYEITTGDVWGGMNYLDFGWRENPTFATPWATSRCFTTYAKTAGNMPENVLSFGVKTTFLFGAVEAKSEPSGIALAHSWPYKGTIRIGNTNLDLPVSLDKVSEISGSPIQDDGCVIIGNLANGRSTICAIDGVLQVRRNYGGLPNEPRNITDVSFAGPAPTPPPENGG